MKRQTFFVLPLLCATVSHAATPPRAPSVASGQMQVAVAVPNETLPNGAMLVLRPARLAPRIAISVLVRAGAADETSATAGWRRVLGNAMLRATTHNGQTLNALEISREAERLGGRLGVSVGDDAVEVFVSGDSDHARELAQLALDVALHPRLSDADIEAAKTRSARNADAQEAVAVRATQSLEAKLFRDSRGQAVAYGLTGSNAQTKRITPDKLRALHAQFFKPSRIIVGAAGDVDAGALRAVVGAGAAGAPQNGDTPPFFARPGKEPPLVVKQLPSDSAYVVVGFAGARAASPDAAALRVALAALTDSRLARLPKRLFKPQLLTRGEGATQLQGQWTPRRFGSELSLFAQTGTGSVDATKNALLDEVRRLRETPLSLAELEAARNFARGEDAVNREGLRERAYNAALWPLLGASSDATWPLLLARVSAQDVQRAAAKYLDTYAVALVLPDNNDATGDDNNLNNNDNAN